MKELIRDAIMEEDYARAELLFRENSCEQEYDDVWAILDASIGAYYGDRERTWEAIRKGLLYNHRNYELYVMLGNFYLEENLQQAYLCYENALFYCKDEEDYVQIRCLMEQLIEEGGLVNRVAFIILSYNLLDMTSLCIKSIRATVPKCACEIVVVDNASEDGSVEWLREQDDVILIENKENMGFPIGCNQGIAAASEDCDIMLLNNDTILVDNSIFWLRMGLYENAKNGAAGSVSNKVGNLQQVADGITEIQKLVEFGVKNNVPMKYPLENKLFLIGFALLIRREVLNEIGNLDERFTPGNSEDLDYGLRVVDAGYCNVLCWNSFIFHFGSASFGKDREAYYALLKLNKRKLGEKWGFGVGYYLYPRRELINMIQEPREKELKVLDVGCGCGSMMGRIKGSYPRATTYGIELVPRAAEFAKHMGEVICGDVENLELPYPEEFFDYIMLGDVLEHLREPKLVLQRLHRLLKSDGCIILSMPNVKHFSVIIPLLTSDLFTYSDAGILDRTHLKMYTGVEISRLIRDSGFEILDMWTTSVGKPSEAEDRVLEHLIKVMDVPDKTTFLAYQYLVKARKC